MNNLLTVYLLSALCFYNTPHQ